MTHSKPARGLPFKAKPPRPRFNPELNFTSLMWPGGQPVRLPSGAAWESDLGLGDVLAALSPHIRYTPYIRQNLTALTTDSQVIAWRQSVLADFIRHPQLVEQTQQLLPRLAGMGQGNALLGKRQRNLLLDTADHLAELETYVDIVQSLHDAFSEAQLHSQALIQLQASLAALIANPDFDTMRKELPDLRKPLERVASLTIGINLDLELRPISAVLLAINDYKFNAQQSWLERVMGSSRDTTDEAGITQLHSTPENPEHRVLAPLFQDLDSLLTQTAQPVSKALSRYARSGSSTLNGLEFELAFFTTAARLFQKLQARGVMCCQPEIVPMEERVIEADGLLNIALVLRPDEKPIASTVDFGEKGRIAVLTGPNSGGKTTYLRSVGLAQVLFQAGLFLPAKTARISPVDTILTHFPALETRQQGRLAEEALRLRDIFRQATHNSFVLLNETFSSTSSGEAVYLAHDILGAMRALGVRAIYATHLVELAERLAEIEADVPGESDLFSLVAGIEVNEAGESAPTYQITRGEPLGRSYAREIARRHGISLEQILAARDNPQP